MTFCSSSKNILATAFLLVSGFAFSNSEYAYNELEDGAEIIGCSGECSVLPEEIDGRKVIGISDTAFSSGSTEHGTVIPWWTSAYNLPMPNQPPNPNQLPMPNQLTIPIIGTLKIPQGYQYIGDNFFSYNAIRDIVIPDSVLDISNDAFSMNPLSYVIFLGNRPNIGDRAFETQYQQLSKELICLLEVRETDKDFNDCYPEMNSANTYFTNCLTAKEASDMLASMTESDLFSMDYGCSSNTYADYEIPHVDLDARIKMTILRIAPEIGFNFNFSSISSPESILSASLCPDESDCDALFGVLCPDELDCDVNDFFAAGFDIDDYINLLSENFDAPFHELDIEDLMSVFESGSFTTHDSVYSIPTAINFIEFSTKVIPEGYSSLIEYKLPPSIYFCSGKIGWPGEPVNGVTPKERDCDSMVWDIDQNNSVDALTDGLLLMRYAFGLRGDSLTENVISSDSLIDKAAVEQNIEQIMHLVDINDDGNFDALTDALILLRYLFDVTGNGLVDEEMLTSNRPSAGSIKAYIESHMIKALSN